MFQRFILAFSLLAISFYTQAQSLPITFNQANHSFSSFGGSQFERVSDPLRPNNTVGKISNAGNDIYEGAFLDINPSIDLDSSKKVHLELHSDLQDSFTIQVKLELSNMGQPDIFVQRRYKSSTWIQDSFDFSKALPIGMTEPINGKGKYKRITLFLNPGINSAGNLYIDNISAYTGTPRSSGNFNLYSQYDSLVWQDEFNQTGALNADNWHFQVIPPNNGGWFNNEIQHYTDRIQNAVCDGNSLHITARKETYTYQGSTKEYTSARLNSKFAFTYGRVDVRAKLPAGSGMWPAIWTLGTNIGETGNYWGRDANTVGWPKCGEIDIMESWGHNPNYVSSAVHTQAQFGSVPTGGKKLNDAYNEYHVYSLVWTPDQLIFYVDSVETYAYNPSTKNADNWPFTKDQYILLNVAVLSSVPQNFDTARMQVDYVRVYQKGSQTATRHELLSENLTLYPNPTNDYIHVFIPYQAGPFFYTIYSETGQIVKKGQMDSRDPRVTVSDLAAGTYCISLNIEGEQSSQPFVILPR
ncbi:MAG: family 16 glycosylhydrolase [Bacteroidia bacterium]